MDSLAKIPFQLDPVAFSIGLVEVRWYGLMYAVAFCVTYALVRFRLKTESFSVTREQLDDFCFWLILSVLLGGRIGYAAFYNFSYFWHHPLEIFLPFQFDNGLQYVGLYGMSFHGGLIGVALAFVLFSRARSLDVWRLSDLFVPAIPLGYFFGRIGNFLNGELFGRPAEVPWAMVFPLDALGVLRHPSQLYEAMGEGLLIFLILWSLRNRIKTPGRLFFLYLVLYGGIRFGLEFFREPDAHIGLIAVGLSLGQVFCLVMAGAGVAGICFKSKAI